MKSWELTSICVPHLKAVLSAVERTQLPSYGIERNFQEIEEALQAFLLYIRRAKQEYECLHQLESDQGANHNPDHKTVKGLLHM